jgi:hypothetical protein
MGGAALARRLWDEGLSVRLIGERVGATKSSIVGYAHRHRWPPRPSPIVRDGVRPEAVPRVAGPPAPAAAAPVAARGPRREACSPEPLAVPTARFHGCQWPTTDARPWRFCDQPVAGPGDVWCAEHKCRVYYRPHPRFLAAVAA